MTISNDDLVDVHAPASTYYTTGDNSSTGTRLRTLTGRYSRSHADNSSRRRRASNDDKSKANRFLIDVKETQRILVEQEDTDGDFQITVNDLGPKSFAVGTADSGGYRTIEIRGTYMLSNLLQELALADDYGRKHIVLDEARLNENPVDRLSRMIRHNFWDGLTRRIDGQGLEIICNDPKNRQADHNPRIYIPFSEDEVFEYYSQVAATRPHLNLEVERLPENITPEYVKSINDRPGILALAMEKTVLNGQETLQGVPFVVPGGRFNEMYGWDSYFESLGLLIDERVDLAKGMVDNFVYEIKHYGKILNANRSYYLSRSQPPFLTDMALKVYAKLPSSTADENKLWLSQVLQAAIKEYTTVWTAQPRLDPKTMLSRFRPEGLGIPPETESSHFDHIIQPYATAAEMSLQDYMTGYNDGTLKEPALDEYFLHDRAVRESGHDTTYRYEKRCANLATIDLNSLLYKYETDIADALQDILDDNLVDFQGVAQHASDWAERARQRRERIDQYLWNEEAGLYYDYDTVIEEQSTYDTVTAYWAMWAKCASHEQAERLTAELHRFEAQGGLVSGTEESRGSISLDRPNRQWDFPFGWAPHQIMTWQAFENYDKVDVARRLAYRWLYTITKSFVDFNGVVPEKYDVVSLTHKVQVEYGNVGTDFKYVPREGFGWMNASYQLGLNLVNTQMRRALGTCTHPDLFFEKALKRQDVDESQVRRRQSSVAAAKAITQNGFSITAMTTFGGESSPFGGSGGFGGGLGGSSAFKTFTSPEADWSPNGSVSGVDSPLEASENED
ncbi:glycoside hydrolase family 37 protein [Phycomyces blakesleeanus NRRL 1555(-)]|uniref:Trehalase n=1 Tax=Phycomyces blakesleeanus (strain ATCC 8743b / DSM 1359 / FGSC 10004 / NBRC 33097 / NRRL 1555) TaxID=763407 RepID=A0A167L2K0_PHYB8|nr:glycoside hydrolase family 37 protein [Phycomyces blakesleeanus NRRL 1555(-)]OAD69446.1 glycoside hydrolase family 37 protein [Phycomyces blakesleeanus NRRL 1555(-)]|eukprot:XP_018287486.1 glycoside hydrolase family 37 protein [Phycomyces blakesleeanus NRRL 1555(-)]